MAERGLFAAAARRGPRGHVDRADARTGQVCGRSGGRSRQRGTGAVRARGDEDAEQPVRGSNGCGECSLPLPSPDTIYDGRLDVKRV